MSEFLKYDEFLLEKKWEKDVESSHLVSMDYDSKTEVLEIEFHDGSVYQYKKVPKSTWRDLSLEKNLLQKVGSGISKGAKKLFGKDTNEGTYGTRFWELIRRGKFESTKIK